MIEGITNPLPNQEVLEVLVTSRRDFDTKENYYCVWEYRPVAPSKGKYIQLISDQDLPLYPGEHTRVSGSFTHRGTLNSPDLLVIDSVEEDSEFVIKKGDPVNLLDPTKGRAPDTSYAVWIKTLINGKPLSIGVPILAFGKTIEDYRAKPLVTITKVDPPNVKRKGYLLYANFPKTNQQTPHQSLLTRLSS